MKCKNPECKKEFKPKNANQYYCCHICNRRHYSTIGKGLNVARKAKRKYKKTDKGRTSEMRYRHSDKGKSQQKNSDKKQNEKFPEKIKARKHANYKYKGVIKICEINICNIIAEKHHPDYSQPDKVKWLCNEHHNMIHGRVAVNV